MPHPKKEVKRVRYTIETTVGKFDKWVWRLFVWITEELIENGDDASFQRINLPQSPRK